jgi:predicted nucleotidyltransferase
MFNPTIEVLVAQPRFRQPPDLTFEGILKRFPGLAEAEAVCLTGSTAMGWGNVFSDIDLYVFSDRTLELPVDETMEKWPGSDKSGVRWDNWMGEYEKSRVDLTVWPTGTLATVLEPYLRDEVEFCGMSDVLKYFVYRMSIAIPLKNEGYFREMSELLDRSSFRRSLARDGKVWAENALTDVAGQLDAGDHASARVSAGIAAAKVADACLVLHGEFCRNAKWIMRRLERKPECGIGVDEYRSVVLDGSRPGESDGDYALRVARWAQGHIVRLDGEFLNAS